MSRTRSCWNCHLKRPLILTRYQCASHLLFDRPVTPTLCTMTRMFHFRCPAGGAMEIRRLRYFLAVAEELHFGRAAARLDIAQPPLSRQVAQLETEIGVELFDRSRSQIRLTQAGSVLRDHTRRLLEQLDEAVAQTRAIGSGHAGRLRIGFTDCAAFGPLPALTQAYRSRFPDVDLALAHYGAGALSRALIQGEIDLAVSRQSLSDEAFRTERLCKEPLVAAVPRHFIGQERHLASLALLSDWPLVTYLPPAAGPAPDPILALCRSEGYQPAQCMPAPDLRAALGLVALGAGVTLVPSSAADICPPEVTLCAYSGRNPEVALSVGVRLDNRGPQVRQFLDLCRQESRSPEMLLPA
ncbi:LysR family transcriptional regulator [Marinibaculum pumilum]|uniref:LysR family transcriptional regulator n=1 Tax=Marinibaculum pumilum TaxID=1766165 RepID=A0ABV7L5I1_9PROT